MSPNPSIMRAVEQLDYRVTVGDVASQAGLDVRLAEQGLLALASEAGGHLQVSDTGEVAYLFPRNFRGVLRSKYWRLRWQENWSKIWKILFYLIRISFGILLIASIALIVIAITIILVAANSNREGGDSRGDSSGGGGFIFIPHFWFGPNWYYMFSTDYGSARQRQRKLATTGRDSEMNFLEAIFSFLFGDGNPNADLDERRWQAIATTIRNNRGAVVAEQIAPYLDDLGSGYQREYEEYMLPVLSRFNGRPEVSPDGQLVYHFPELQVSANDYRLRSIPAYLKEQPWRFTSASSGQVMMAIGLGAVNIVGALMLGSLLGDGAIAAQIGGLVAFVAGIYWLLLAYGIAFLGIPLLRYFWINWRNKAVEQRNEVRQEQADYLNQADETVRKKLTFAHQFAASTVVDANDLAYTTETDLTEQELLNSDKTDAEWQRRLEQGF